MFCFCAHLSKGWFIIWHKDLRCVVLWPDVHIKWFGQRQRRNRKISIPAFHCRPSHFICTSGRNTMQRKSLRHIINQPLGCAVVPLSSSSSSFSSFLPPLPTPLPPPPPPSPPHPPLVCFLFLLLPLYPFHCYLYFTSSFVPVVFSQFIHNFIFMTSQWCGVHMVGLLPATGEGVVVRVVSQYGLLATIVVVVVSGSHVAELTALQSSLVQVNLALCWLCSICTSGSK